MGDSSSDDGFVAAMKAVKLHIARTRRRDGDSEWNQALEALADSLPLGAYEVTALQDEARGKELKFFGALLGIPKGISESWSSYRWRLGVRLEELVTMTHNQEKQT